MSLATGAAPRGGPAAARGASTTGYRPEIDGVRALAVVAVVAYHAGIPGFSGGYVGVDVFFVISGFLITGLLARELEHTGRVSVAGFYGRRARRLLPVAALVSVATVAVGWWVQSPLTRRDLAADALATSTYTINLRLAAQQLDYLRANLAPSAFQQFWSLAVEEQFYLVWPLLLVVLLRGVSPRRRAGGVIAVVCCASFALAVSRVGPSPAWAFYSLASRGWQLGSGALLALGWYRVERVLPRSARRLALVLGLGAIAVSVIGFGESTPWPGWWALVPTLGTVLVLLGPTSTDGRLAALLSARPARWVGLRSYSWYLWHWPAMVFVAAWLDRSIGGWPAILMAAASLGLAAVTYRWVEQPVRRSPRLVGSPRRSVALGLGTTIVLATVFLALMSVPGDVVGPGERAEDIARRALDARRLDEAALVEEVPSNLVPALAGADQDLPTVYDDGCHRSILQTTPILCGYGDARADRRVVIFGDSHAAQWVPALDALGRRAHFTLVPITKAGCPAADVTVYDGSLRRAYTECDRWRASALQMIADLGADLVLVTNTSRYVAEGNDGPPSNAEWTAGFEATLTALAEHAPTALLGDTPYPKEYTPDCLAEHLGDATACTLDRGASVDREFAALEASSAAAAEVPYVPTTDLVCGRVRCPVIVGNVLVYRDDSHLTAVYAERLAPRLAELVGLGLPGDNPLVDGDG